MANGYMGRILNVDLSSGKIEEEPLDEALCRDLVGGYGIGAKLLLDRIPPKADPLGPQNILGFMTGPLTGTDAITGNRYTVVCKAPKTGGWGDANCGGTFGPHLKFAGYDGILFSGQAEEPVYLFIDSGRAELRPAGHLWGKDVDETEDTLKAELGDVQVASIGPSGEKLSLMAAVMNDKGRAAARSGVGAVMGSKKLKAVAVKGKLPIEIAAPELAKELRKYYLKRSTGDYKSLSTYGTPNVLPIHLLDGDSPVKNWAGIGYRDLPEGAERFNAEANKQAYRDRKYGCWRCPIACGGLVSVKHEGPYQGVKGHQAEYETSCMFGTDILNDNYASTIKANDICNRYGLDTIAAGATVAFATECFEAGIITVEDTGGIRLGWGKDEAIIAMLEKLAKREGFGDVLADGVKVAAERIGRGAEQFAMHIQGEEVPAHDPKYIPALAIVYTMDATPARHTQGGAFWFSPGYAVPSGFKKYELEKWGDLNRRMWCFLHVVNAAGLCRFAHDSYHFTFIPNFLSAVTGKEWSLADCEVAGERIANLRHAFNLREGLNPREFAVPGRILGNPPFEEGPTAGITIDREKLVGAFLESMQWDQRSTYPSPSKLKELGIGYLAEMLPAQ